METDQTELRRLVAELIEKRAYLDAIGMRRYAKNAALSAAIDLEIQYLSALDAVTEAACAVDQYRKTPKC